MRIYMGIDPTATYIHLGHTTNYLLLERFHNLGHKIIVLVGDFTAQIGDPSDKSSARVKLTNPDVMANLKSYKEQIGKILNFNDKKNPIEFRFNSEWLAKLNFTELVDLASNFTVQQMIERDTFAKRLVDEKPLYVHEFFYPLMQGYDSVALEADIEIGGTDQTFNMLSGRTLVKRYQDREKFVITTTLLENSLTGEKLMSKSLGTGVGIDLYPNDMYAKVMALPDEAILPCLVDCTRLPMVDVDILKTSLINGENPRNVKMSLAREITAMYHGEAKALEAEAAWNKQFREGGQPDDIASHKLTINTLTAIQVLQEVGFADSNSEARRLVEQGGAHYTPKGDSEMALELERIYDFGSGDIIRAGKRRYVRLKV